MTKNASVSSDSPGSLALDPTESPEVGDFFAGNNNSGEDDAEDTSQVPAYEYEPLPSRDHIRRLLLHPGTGSSVLIGTLQHVTLDSITSSNNFEAISYVWGSAVRDQYILIDGKPLAITTNLRESLLQVRLPDRIRPIWADSVCIDQENTTEKGDQVALMGRIYRISSRTLICLGARAEHQREAKEAATLIESVDRMIHRVYNDPQFSWGWDTFPWPDPEESLLNDKAWTSCYTLTNQHPWFRRGWVVQEAALGATALIYWAGFKIEWMSLLRVHYWYRWRVRPLMSSYSVLWGILSLHQTAFKVACHREARTFHPERMQRRLETDTILQTLDSTRWLELADPKDRIYAFMAMRTRGVVPQLQPDYRPVKSHLEVYRDFAVSYLESTSDLDILGFVEYDHDSCLRDRRISSWIPQWDQGTQVYGERNWFRDWRKVEDTGGSTGPNRQQSFSIIEGGSALRVRGIIIDTVQYVSERIQDPVGDQSALGQLLTLWENVVHESTQRPELLPAHRSLSFLSALARGEMQGRRDEWNSSLHTLGALLQSGLHHSKTATPNAERIALPLMHLSRSRKSALLGRGYFGNTPDATRAGDTCAIIHGTRTPFILRNMHGNCYRLVGAACVVSKNVDANGIPMRLGDDGCEDWRDWSLKAEDIVLC